MSTGAYFRFLIKTVGPHVRTMGMAETRMRHLLGSYARDASLPIVNESIFYPLSTDPRMIAQKIYNDPKSPDVTAILDSVSHLMHEHTPGYSDGNDVMSYARATNQGHIATMSSRQPYAGEQKDVLRHMLLSFPQGGVIMTPEWLDKVVKSEDRHQFIKENFAEMQKAGEVHLLNGGKLEGCGALLGNRCLVKVRDVQERVDPQTGRRSHHMTVATTDEHNLDGINIWSAHFDPARPGECLFSNILIGKHPAPLAVDFLNNVIGKGLMTTMWKTVNELHTCEQTGERLEKRITEHRSDLDWSRWWYRKMDYLSPAGVELRKLLEPNMTAPTDVYVVRNEDFVEDGDKLREIAEKIRTDPDYAKNALQTTTDGPGFDFNDKPFNAAESFSFERLGFGQGGQLDILKPEKRNLAEKKIRDIINLEGGHMESTMEEAIKEVPKTGEEMLAADDKLRQYLETTDLASTFEKRMRNEMITADVRDAVLDAFDANAIVPQEAKHQIPDVATSMVDRLVLQPMFEPSGVFRELALLTLTQGDKPPYSYDKVVDQIKLFDTNIALKNQEILHKMQEAEKLKKGDPERIELEKKVELAKREVEKTTEKRERAEEARKESKEWDKRKIERKEKYKESRDKYVHHGKA